MMTETEAIRQACIELYVKGLIVPSLSSEWGYKYAKYNHDMISVEGVARQLISAPPFYDWDTFCIAARSSLEIIDSPLMKAL